MVVRGRPDDLMLRFVLRPVNEAECEALIPELPALS